MELLPLEERPEVSTEKERQPSRSDHPEEDIGRGDRCSLSEDTVKETNDDLDAKLSLYLNVVSLIFLKEKVFNGIYGLQKSLKFLREAILFTMKIG